MVVAPITKILCPPRELRGMMVVAATTVAAGAGAVKTITIPDAYPAIDRTIQSPVLAILIGQSAATLVIDGSGVFAVGGQCDGVPDSAGEFQITGARTIDIWKIANKTAVAVVCYISKGSGQKT